jgi:hypothetical protein
MKWLVSLLLVLCIVTPAMAGEDPYIAVVGNDIAANPFYLSPKYLQFIYDQTAFGVPTTGEQFVSQMVVNKPEICDLSGEGTGPLFTFRGNPNSRVTSANAGYWAWYIRLPKKPSGEINLVFQCGVVKPNAFALWNFQAVELCAAETGEKVGPECSRLLLNPGEDPIVAAGLPQITAIAIPGPYNSFTPFYLTAYKNPGTYTLGFDDSGAIKNSAASQLLDGTANTRILLKACMDKTIVAKIPVAGQVNAGKPAPPISVSITDVESDLVEGDIIYVKMALPRQNTVDVYCHSQSLRLMGVGESPF